MPSQKPLSSARRRSVVAAKPRAGRKTAAKQKLPAADATRAATGKLALKAHKGRPKLVRDSFTMPESDFELIEALKARALGAQRAAKKSELLRAGLQALAALEASALVVALDKLEPIKTGRPKKGH